MAKAVKKEVVKEKVLGENTQQDVQPTAQEESGAIKASNSGDVWIGGEGKIQEDGPIDSGETRIDETPLTFVEKLEIDESELKEKTLELETFIVSGGTFNLLSQQERTLLLNQLKFMKSYLDCVTRRIQLLSV